MSYLKQIVVRNLTISSVDGDKVAVLGDNITSVLSISYFENIFHPTYEFEDADLARTLEKNGFITTYFNYPDAYGPIVGRIVLSAYHDKEDIQQLANCLNALQD